MIFKAVTVLLTVLCSSLALIPQLTPGLFSFNLFRSPIAFPCCDPALRRCATQSNIVCRNVMLSILEYMDPILGHTETSNEYHSSQTNF
ncbi:hypothetical protein P692DRAFT_2039956 [Suillus brevipes Sb2]|nr:hypothetical protein P692DRAFT_2039956 [Suillus brevipes Sb2]